MGTKFSFIFLAKYRILTDNRSFNICSVLRCRRHDASGPHSGALHIRVSPGTHPASDRAPSPHRVSHPPPDIPDIPPERLSLRTEALLALARRTAFLPARGQQTLARFCLLFHLQGNKRKQLLLCFTSYTNSHNPLIHSS